MEIINISKFNVKNLGFRSDSDSIGPHLHSENYWIIDQFERRINKLSDYVTNNDTKLLRQLPNEEVCMA